ncbi:MAG: TatD family hydrolase [Treponema sp.]|nr:TatD family hydrolase [Treponema sp.]
MNKNSLALFCDAHFHLLPSEEALQGLPFLLGRAVTAAHSPQEFLAQEERVKQLNASAIPAPDNDNSSARLFPCAQPSSPRVLQSFGLHPQAPFDGEADFALRLEFLEGLLRERRVQAIGECGLDFFTPEFSAKRAAQEKAFAAQLEAAARHKVPVVVHARKAMQEIFAAAAALKKVPAVVFHSFAGSPADARSLLSKGINAYFSFGKPIVNGAKKAMHCVRALPIERLLFETDAPYQKLKGEKATSPAEIADVYQAAFELRTAGIPYEARPSFIDFSAEIEKNFRAVFGA